MTADKILDIARSQIGTKESPANSNRVKYNTEYYEREVSGSKYAWCCAFVWWCFKQAGASDLFYGGGKTAYCPTLKTYHKAQAVTDYKPGDVIFFNFSGGTAAKHVGICESWDGKYITTIDGNTGSGDQANGGAVMRQKRAKKYIVGGYRPKYIKRKEKPEVTYEQWKAFMLQYRKELQDNDCGEWSKEAREWCIQKGIFAGSDSNLDGLPNYMWQDLLTREQAAALFYRYAKLTGLA